MKKEKLPMIKENYLISLLQRLGVPINQPKRKRGRPRKVPEGITDNYQKEAKKRGRPKKITDTIEITEKKKRGRPRKVAIESLLKKKRGRPRKYSLETLNKPELQVVPVLIDILKQSHKPVHAPALLNSINKTLKTSYADTTLRKVINYIRAKSLSPIVSVNGTGYEITTSKKKINEQIHSLNKRASSIVSSAHGLKKFL
jgi:hypothetical protein